MTEHGKPAQMLALARQRIVAELDKAQQATANLGDEVAARNREIAKWLMRSDALLFALDALGPAPVPRGRKPAANGTVEKPKRAQSAQYAGIAPAAPSIRLATLRRWRRTRPDGRCAGDGGGEKLLSMWG